ncbi:hypothetical protein [Spiroplasma endosymbiont of Polydrusus formosus]|uniref:hypothetical protein n=1 Tax=Spiroplasma endosymbiont of Polydrusus formosus TaxID=3139326 RepID=UPI0035B5674B
MSGDTSDVSELETAVKSKNHSYQNGDFILENIKSPIVLVIANPNKYSGKV